ncbi:MAG: hypothetical protein TREMPRED_002046 [Tremellales sp. Tagirdzhanova-0007]|nr:MAG: hypothetical protein TREMPRED_002046 [Tremellales sp. Tagirdzhanova-0007]
MDITLLPPSTILSHHSHHIYQPLLPTAAPRRRSPYSYTCPAPRSPFLTPYDPYRIKRRFEPPPPLDGSCPLDLLPDEIFLTILSHFEWDELLILRTVNRRLSELALSPALHHSLTLLSLPSSPLPTVLADHILPATRDLHLHLFPYPAASRSSHPSPMLLWFFQFISPDQLRSLSLPFSAPYLSMTEMGEISRIGGKLEQLDLRGSGLTGADWDIWLENVGVTGRGLKELNLGFTGISSLPLERDHHPPTSDPTSGIPQTPYQPHLFRSLSFLSLASCASISSSVLTSFLATLPPTLERLDLSRLDQITFPALWSMRVTELSDGQSEKPIVTTALREIKVVGVDHLTRRDIRKLKRHWEDQRRACFPQPVVAPISVQARRVWGVPRTPEHRTPPTKVIPLSPPDTPVTQERPVDSLVRHPFYLNIPSFNMMANFGVPTPPPSQRSSPSHDTDCDVKPDPITINIIHSAILESEDEAGYRQFIGEVAGGMVAVGLGLEWDEAQGDGEAWVEVDGGGMI